MNNELYHHGIRGQRWGKKNGPPYPLSESDHSASEKKAGWKKSLANDPDLKEKKQKVRTARKEYNKAFNEADIKSMSAYSPIKSHRDANKARWENAWQKQEEYQIAKKEYKEAKKAAKDTLKKYGNRNINDKDEGSVKGSRDLKTQLGVTDNEADKLKKAAKIAGISLATTAGIVAAGYMLSKNNNSLSDVGIDFSNILSPSKALGINKSQTEAVEKALEGINKDPTHSRRPFDIGSRLLNNSFNGSYIGKEAKEHGYSEIGEEFIKKAIEHPKSSSDFSMNDLVKEVRVNQVSPDATRRLSCWSASNAYFLSALTGEQFASKSFSNLVNFNDFGKLFKKQPQIFDAFGNSASTFVGKFGRSSARGDMNTMFSLISSIFDNVSSSNNLSPDGKRTVGFINAAYHGMTCTHQWNFEIFHGVDGAKTLYMSDGYSGDRYPVAKMIDGVVKYSRDGAMTFSNEIFHYNADSFRFYAPSLSSIDPSVVSKIVLGKT